MSWTEERTATAIRMFTREGYSASQIARFLGGVSRNAVIGKLFRTGNMANGRSLNAESLRKPSPPRAIGASTREVADKVGAPRGGKSGHKAGSDEAKAIAVKSLATKAQRRPINRDAKVREEAAPALQIVRVVSTREKAVDDGDVVTKAAQAEPSTSWATAKAVMGLEPNHCRWPIGDTRSDSFSFCCARKKDGSSYCAEHHRVSVSTSQPKPVRPPADPNVRRNSQVAAERREAAGAWS